MDMRLLIRSEQFHAPLPFNYLNDATGKYIPVPYRVDAQLRAARTPQEVNEVLKRTEKELAGAGGEEFLACDVVADLMVDVLKYHGYRAKGVVGYSDEGSFHAWVEVDGVRYDPTEQGCWTTPPEQGPRGFVRRGRLAERYGP